MTKRKKIIISIISVVMAVALITTALLVILSSKFRVENFDDPDYTSHTTAKVITLDNQYKRTFIDRHYENGCEIIQNNDNKYGLFSNISDSIVVPTAYDRYEILSSNSDTNKTYIKFYNSAKDSDGFVVFDEIGNKIFETTIDNNYEKVSNVKIITKKVNLDKKHKVEESKENISVENITLDRSFYKENEYNYEAWNITDTQDNSYINLYKVECNKRCLVTTIGGAIGNDINSSEITSDNIFFLTNGEPIIVTEEIKNISFQNDVIEYKIYDKKLELKNTVTLKLDMSAGKFRIGNYLFYQYAEESNEDDYDFLITEGGENTYYKLFTHKINLKNGKVSEINSKILALSANNVTTNLNENIVDVNNIVLNAYLIENKEIDTPKLMLVDDEFNHKEITFEFDSITKISKNRFLVSDNNANHKVIDKNYEVIADFSNYNNIFTTEENIIASDSNYTYICSHDGIVLARYAIGNIINVNNSEYYIVKENNLENNTSNYKRGSNGEEFEIIYTLSNNGTFTIKESLSFNSINTFIGNGYSYILATNIEGSDTKYSVFNFDGTLLHTFTLPTQSITPGHIVYDDYVVVKMSSHTFVLDR